MKKELLILFGIFFLLNLNFVSSHFVCGVVNDSDSLISASWHNVKVFYSGEENNFASCEVSPDENKYCCDVEEIQEHLFNPGETIFAKTNDLDSGYSAGPVSITLTSESYDVMPEMKLEKVINIYSPGKRIIFSNDTFVFLNMSFFSHYNFIQLEKGSETLALCNNCTNYEEVLAFDFGMNEFRIFAKDSDEIFIEERSFAILNEMNFGREAVCKGCKNGHVKGSSVVDINLGLNLSHEVSGFLLKEYVPSSWEILDSGEGEIKNFNEDYNLIVWNVTGKDFSFDYSVLSPGIGFRPQEFLFKSELEDFNLGENPVFVIRFFPFWAKKQAFSFYFRGWLKKIKIDSNHPLVFDSDDKRIHGAVLVNKLIHNAGFEIFRDDFSFPFKNMNVVRSYSVNSNLDKRATERISFELKLKKSEVSDAGELMFFVKSGSWKEVKPIEFSEDENYFYFSFDTDYFSKFFAGLKKENFFRRIFFRFTKR